MRSALGPPIAPSDLGPFGPFPLAAEADRNNKIVVIREKTVIAQVNAISTAPRDEWAP